MYMGEVNVNIRKHNCGSYIVPDDTRGGICLDIGANVGSFFRQYADHFSRIYYCEPIYDCFQICEVIAQKFRNIIGFNKACYDESHKFVDLVLHKNNDSGSTAIKNNIEKQGDWTSKIVSVAETISLEDLIKATDSSIIDYCKMDCETSEYNILLGKDLTKIRYLAIEIHAQLGEQKNEELIQYILRTHQLVSKQTIFNSNQNRTLLFKR